MQVQARVGADHVLAHLAAQCREQPLVIDDVRSDLCVPLKQVILGRMQRDHGRRTATLNVGGWKSGEDFFAWPDPAVQDLRQVIVDQVGGARPIVGWAMVNRAGSYHPRHQHRVALITGVYYVGAGSPEAITPTVFECAGCDVAVDPVPGRLAIFPGEMWHSVPVYAGDLPRITIAFDVRR